MHIARLITALLSLWQLAQIRTLQSEAVLLYVSSGEHMERDFLAIELDAGRPRYVFDTGNGPRHIMAPAGSTPVNDGRWHEIGIVRSDLTDHRKHWLIIDGLLNYDLHQSVSRSLTHI